MEKSEARRQVREAIRQLTRPEREANSEAVRRRLSHLPELLRAKSVMAFLPLPDEVDTRPILSDLLAAGKRVYVPRTYVQWRVMIPVRLNALDHLRVGEYNIPEPEGEETCPATELDFVIVPGRAFDRAGNRVGRGAGFYDRFMAPAAFHAVRCGIAFSCQVLPEVPHGPTDLPMDLIVTEEMTLRMVDAARNHS